VAEHVCIVANLHQQPGTVHQMITELINRGRRIVLLAQNNKAFVHFCLHGILADLICFQLFLHPERERAKHHAGTFCRNQHCNLTAFVPEFKQIIEHCIVKFNPGLRQKFPVFPQNRHDL